MTHSSTAFALLCLLACGNAPQETMQEATQAQSAQHDVHDGFFVAPGAPTPRACTADDQCVGDTIPDTANPCCNNPRTLRAYGRDYKNWVNTWRASNCDGVTCPPPPNPSLPPDCAFQVRCENNQCVDSCP